MSQTQTTAPGTPPETLEDFELDLDELESAEDFLTYFAVPFDAAIVHVNRLHILQRFHDYLSDLDELPDSVTARYAAHAALLQRAYQDFVDSDAQTEKVFRVFHMHEPPKAEIALSDLLGELPAKTTQRETPTADPGEQHAS